MRADGTVERELDLDTLRGELERAKADGIGAVAIVLMHAYRSSDHERRVAALLAREIGFPQVSASHEVSPLIKLVSRGDTTVVDSYLSPILQRYVAQVAGDLDPDGAAERTRLMFMMSSGGLTAADLFRGKDAILSGPAGGVVGMAETGRSAGFTKLIGFDMGGTSTDVSHFAGEYERAFETEVAGVRMRAPMMLIPHCRRRRRLDPDISTAHDFGSDPTPPGPIRDRNATAAAVRSRSPTPMSWSASSFRISSRRSSGLTRTWRSTPAPCEKPSPSCQRRSATARPRSRPPTAFIKIAVENMANAIKKISVQRGYDVTRYALNCFGGAGGQHACLVADALGMTSVLIHPLSSLLSAYGMGLADIRSVRQQAVEEPFGKKAFTALETQAKRLARDVTDEVFGQGVAKDKITLHVRAHIRLRRHRHPFDCRRRQVEALPARRS